MDVIFSNSALHWIQDHRKAFQNFWKMLKPMNSDNGTDMSIDSNSNNTSISGQLLIQCGGYGNLQQIITMLERITDLDEFREQFETGNNHEISPSLRILLKCFRKQAMSIVQYT